MFSAKIKFYDEVKDEISYLFCLVPAKDFHEAIDKIGNYIGIVNLIEVNLEWLSPDDIVTFNTAESKQIFKTVKKHIKEKAIW